MRSCKLNQTQWRKMCTTESNWYLQLKFSGLILLSHGIYQYSITALKISAVVQSDRILQSIEQDTIDIVVIKVYELWCSIRPTPLFVRLLRQCCLTYFDNCRLVYLLSAWNKCMQISLNWLINNTKQYLLMEPEYNLCINITSYKLTQTRPSDWNGTLSYIYYRTVKVSACWILTGYLALSAECIKRGSSITKEGK